MAIGSEIISAGSWNMSRVAARRLLQDGIRVSVETDNHLGVYQNANHPIFDLWERGCYVVPLVNFDMRPHVAGGNGNPEYLANHLLSMVLACKAAFAISHPGVEFRWGLKNNTIGSPIAFSDGWCELPRFVSHPSDTPVGLFSSERMVPLNHGFGTWTVRVVSGATSDSFVIDATSTGGYKGREWINQFPGSDYLTKNPAFYFAWTTGPNVGQTHRVSGWDAATGRITLNSAPSSAIANSHEGKLYSILSWGGQADGCIFFRNGAAETEAWTIRFREEWKRLGAEAQVGRPVVYAVTAEDTHLPSWSSFGGKTFQVNVASSQASDPTQVMDKTGRTLLQHMAAFAKTRNGSAIDFEAGISPFSPQAGAQNGYLFEAYFSAHALWFQRAHLDPLKEIWPETYMYKYKVPNNVTDDFTNLLPRPDSERFLPPDVGGIASMDIGTIYFDHYDLPIAAFRATMSLHAGQVTSSGFSPTTTQFKVVDVDTTNNPITSKANDYWNGQEIRIDKAQLPRDVRTISDWDGGTDVFTVPTLSEVPANSQAMSVLFESGTLIQQFNAGIGWDIYASFAVWAGEDLSEEGLPAIAKAWTKHLTQLTMERYPDTPLNAFFKTLGNPASTRIFPREYSYPHPEFEIAGGYLTDQDWTDLLLDLLRLGQNCFTWFQPSGFAADVDGQATQVAFVVGKMLDALENIEGEGSRENLELIAFGEATRSSVRFRADRGRSLVMIVGELPTEDEDLDELNVIVTEIGDDAISPSKESEA